MPTINDLLDKYLREGMDDLAPSTKKGYLFHIPRLRQRFGHKDVSSSDIRQDVTNFLDPGRKKGLYHRDRSVAVLMSAFREGLRWRWITANPLTLIERPPAPKRPDLTLIQFEEFLQYAKAGTPAAQLMGLILEFSFLTGLGQGEVLRLVWDQVDFDKEVIRRTGSKGKGKQSVQMTAEAKELLKARKAEAKQKGNKSKYVFGTLEGDAAYTGAGFRQNFQKVLIKWQESGRERITFPQVKRLGDQVRAEREKARSADPLSEFAEFSQSLKLQAALNAPFYQMVYCLERMIRDRVTGVMEQAEGEGWWDSNRIDPEVRRKARDLNERERDKAFNQRARMIDYTTLGQLGEIITKNWDLFEPHYQSAKAVNNAVAELNLVRGPIAHCCPLEEEEIVRLKLYVHNWFKLVEKH